MDFKLFKESWEKSKRKFLSKMVKSFYWLKFRNWVQILWIIIALELSLFVFIWINHHNPSLYDVDNSLELILTINGLFSAILITYFFNRIVWIKEQRKEVYKESQFYSQKITDFRRILNILTRYYGVWVSDEATKSLLSHGAYKHIDYFDYKLESFSDYESADHKLIIQLMDDERHGDISDLYLAMISLVTNRKSWLQIPDSELYGHYQRKGIYTYKFVERCMNIEYVSRMSYWFDNNFHFINYNNLGQQNRQEILEIAKRIDEKYDGRDLDNRLMADLCRDIHDFYFTELYNNLLVLRKGISPNDRVIYVMIIFSLLFGVFLPFSVYTIINEIGLKRILSEILVAINLGMLLFLITNLYRIVKQDLTLS